MNDQMDLFGRAHIPVHDPGADTDDRPRLRGHNRIIFERLQQGEATNRELAVLLGPASAWRTRVSDVRLWLEATGKETVLATKVERGLWMYRIGKLGEEP